MREESDRVGDRAPEVTREETRTGGRPATQGVIPGQYSLSVGKPDKPAPLGWSWTPLTEVARLETGHTPSRRHPEYWDGDIPWIGIRDATENHGRTLVDTYQHTNALGIANSSARLLPARTVCLSRTASVGYVVVMGRPMATSQDFVNWVCSDRLDHDFLKYVLLAEHHTFLTFASGTTHQTIYFPEVKAFHLCLPPLDTQHKVVGILSAYDDLIENNNRRVGILEEMAWRIYREWFGDFRYPGHESVPMVQTAIGPTPDKWTVGVLADLVAINAKTIKSVQPDEWIRYIDITSVRRGVVEPPKRMPLSRAPGRARRRVSDGDILWSTVRPNLRAYALVLNPGANLVASTGFAILTPQRASFAYVYCMTTTDQFVEYISGRATGSAYPAVTAATFEKAPILIPPARLLEDFAVCAEPLLRMASALYAQSNNLFAARDLLLHRLISGELDVANLDIRIPDASA